MAPVKAALWGAKAEESSPRALLSRQHSKQEHLCLLRLPGTSLMLPCICQGFEDDLGGPKETQLKH